MTTLLIPITLKLGEETSCRDCEYHRNFAVEPYCALFLQLMNKRVRIKDSKRPKECFEAEAKANKESLKGLEKTYKGFKVDENGQVETPNGKVWF